MHLSPRELDKLVLCQVGLLAQQRLVRGLQLNHSEACALIACQLLELIRDGQHTVTQLMSIGRRILGRRHVLPSVPHTLHEVQVEGTFPDGTKLVTVHSPIASDDGDLALALHGSGLATPPSSLVFPPLKDPLPPSEAPGALQCCSEPGKMLITLCPGRRRRELLVTNDGDRCIQVGSHYHFIECNRMLEFDRRLAYGYRLDIPAGTAVRFEPGESKTVRLVEIGGRRIISGGNGLASGPVQALAVDDIVERLIGRGFRHKPITIDNDTDTDAANLAPCQIPRSVYAHAYGPTVGDRVRLADTDLWLEVEGDLTCYGDESVFGGGKVIREGMGQCNDAILVIQALDLVITNALVIDYTGIFKADIGVKDGKIVGIGKSGNPDIMDDVTEGMIIGPMTEVLAGEGKILTAGGLDTHIHFICPQICTEALSSGLTTLIGGGTGPNTGTKATTCTPGPANLSFMLRAIDGIPLNFGFTGKGNCSSTAPLRQQIEAGAIGLKLHEDYGTTPAAIDACLQVCDEFDVQATIHTDTLNESGFVEDSIAAFRDRTIHTYHSEGAGGGHAPDIIRVCSMPNVIPSSTNPTRPFTKNTVDEHLDMLMVCHHLDPSLPEDVAFAESRIRGETIGAEDLLQDMGAISIISSDSQAMGRVGEVISRTWQTADKMKRLRGELRPNRVVGGTDVLSLADNYRIRRYVSKALAHGVGHLVGSIEVGKLADLVLWLPEWFGTKPECVLKAGTIVWSQMGDANASIPTPQPFFGRPMFGAEPSAACHNSVTFVSQAALESGIKERLGLRKHLEAVRGCRNVRKSDMRWNDYQPTIDVDPETYQVTVNGTMCNVPPADSVSQSRQYYIF